MKLKTRLSLLTLLFLILAASVYGVADIVAINGGSVVIDPPQDNTDWTDLSSADTTQMGAIIAADSRIQTLLAGRTYTLGESGPWFSADAGTIGGSAVLTLSSPLSADYTWPVVTGYMGKAQIMSMRCVESYCPPYFTGSASYHVTNATELYVDVDLTSGAVVGISPLEAEVNPIGTESTDTTAEAGEY